MIGCMNGNLLRMNRQSARQNLMVAWIKTICVLSGIIRIPADIAAKTYEYYLRTIEGLVRDLYRGDIDEGDFVGSMADLIQAQLTRAWNEGMRENELDPQEDMEPEWQAKLDEIILSEYDYVDGFAADIVALSKEMGGFEEGWEPLMSRAEMWANRYNDVVNQSIMITKEQKLIWVYGDTDHCGNCLHLNGIVAWSSEWEEAGVKPQGDMLACGGFHCQCEIVPTSNRHTRNALDAIAQAMSFTE
jgi:hypothetical protein